MPSLLGRLRFGRVSTSDSLASPQSPECSNAKVNRIAEHSNSSESPASSRRFRSWFSLKRPRKERAENQPSGRPPTPTPHLALSSGSLDASRQNVLKKRKCPLNINATLASNEEDEKTTRNVDDDEELMSEEERTRMSSIANSVKGLMEQYRIVLNDTSSTPPMSKSDGTPLSPISETDELENETSSLSISPQPVPTSSSSDEVTDLDYGELLHPEDLEMELGALDDDLNLVKDADDNDEELMPRWNPDVAEMIQLEVGVCHQQNSSVAPLTPVSAVHGDGGQVDDAVIEREVSLDEGILPQITAQAGTETEDDSEYYSAPSVPISSGDEDEESEADIDHGPNIGLRLRGVELASVSSSESYGSELSDENEETEEDVTITPRSPGLSARHRFHSQPHPIFRPETIDGAMNSASTRQRATTLLIGQDRALPALPRLLIPAGSDDIQVNERYKDADELRRTIAQLRREKAKLEEALLQANRQIEQKDHCIAFLTTQLDKLHSTLIRFVRKEVEGAYSSDTSSDSSVPIVVRAPSDSVDANTVEPVNAEPSAFAPAAAAAAGGALTILSTPPATPDRRAVITLTRDANATEGHAEEDADSTPKPARSLFRRKSAGASSTLSELGIGRAQMKRRAGSENLRSLTASLSE